MPESSSWSWLTNLIRSHFAVVQKVLDLIVKELTPVEKRPSLSRKVDQEPKPALQATDSILVPAFIPSHIDFAAAG